VKSQSQRAVNTLAYWNDNDGNDKSDKMVVSMIQVDWTVIVSPTSSLPSMPLLFPPVQTVESIDSLLTTYSANPVIQMYLWKHSDTNVALARHSTNNATTATHSHHHLTENRLFWSLSALNQFGIHTLVSHYFHASMDEVCKSQYSLYINNVMITFFD